MVALFTRAWIEMLTALGQKIAAEVALFTRAWIEIVWFCRPPCRRWVALFTRAWIEILTENQTLPDPERRPLHEGVD